MLHVALHRQAAISRLSSPDAILMASAPPSTIMTAVVRGLLKRRVHGRQVPHSSKQLSLLSPIPRRSWQQLRAAGLSALPDRMSGRGEKDWQWRKFLATTSKARRQATDVTANLSPRHYLRRVRAILVLQAPATAWCHWGQHDRLALINGRAMAAAALDCPPKDCL